MIDINPIQIFHLLLEKRMSKHVVCPSSFRLSNLLAEFAPGSGGFNMAFISPLIEMGDFC